MLQHVQGRGFQVERDADLAGRLQLLATGPGGSLRVVICGYQGPDLPATLHRVALTGGKGGARRQAWHLECTEGRFDFEAVSVECLEEKPELYLPLHRPFALRGRDRIALRALLLLLRLPGSSVWLRRWHDRRR